MSITLADMTKKTLALIEELNPNSAHLTDDDDIATKRNYVTNQVMYELARIKKIPKYIEMNVRMGDLITINDIGDKCGYEVYQLGKVCGVEHISKASGTVLKILEDGIIEIECFVYPERIDDKTKDKGYEFELSSDVLEIMPYGIAADLLKSDESAQYGRIYNDRYERMKQELDTRYQTTTIHVRGGIKI